MIDFITLAKYAGGATAIGAAIVGVFKAFSFIATRLRILDMLGAHMKPNGGSSWDDKLNTIVAGNNALLIEFRTARDRLALVDARGDLALSGLDLGAMHFDVKGECYEVSEAIERHSGRTTEDLIGSGWLGCLCEEDQGRVTAHWADAVSRRRRMTEEFSWLRQDGYMTAVRFKSRPIRRDGELIGFTAFLGRMEAVTWPMLLPDKPRESTP